MSILGVVLIIPFEHAARKTFDLDEVNSQLVTKYIGDDNESSLIIPGRHIELASTIGSGMYIGNIAT